LFKKVNSAMRLDYRVVEVTKGQERECNYCPLNFEDQTNLNFNTSPASHQVVALDKETSDYADIAFICGKCKDDFENDNLPWCEKCGRLKPNRRNCFCHLIKNKSTKPLSSETLISRSLSSRLENRIKELEKELTISKVEINTHLEALQVSEGWSKAKIDRIKELEAEVARLKEENKQLKEQQNGQVTQIEVKEPKRWSWLKVKK
jgi:hypothetical protein